MLTSLRRFSATSRWLTLIYCLTTILYIAFATIPTRARPLQAGTIPTLTNTSLPSPTSTVTKTPKATRTTKPTKTPTLSPTAMVSETATPTPIDTPTNTDRPNPTITAAPSATSTPTATPTVAGVQLALTKTDFLFADTDGNNLPSPGDMLLYVITVINAGHRPAQQLHLEDRLDPNTTLVVGTVNTDYGTISTGNHVGDEHPTIDIATLEPGARAVVHFQASINTPATDTQVQNQAVLAFSSTPGGPSGQTVIISDDPDTTEALDATITPLNGNEPRPRDKTFLPFIHKN